jgi:hypothetical protein
MSEEKEQTLITKLFHTVVLTIASCMVLGFFSFFAWLGSTVIDIQSQVSQISQEQKVQDEEKSKMFEELLKETFKAKVDAEKAQEKAVDSEKIKKELDKTTTLPKPHVKPKDDEEVKINIQEEMQKYLDQLEKEKQKELIKAEREAKEKKLLEQKYEEYKHQLEQRIIVPRERLQQKK